ncbi:hypothetical protein L226DRAFT_525837 [Lentinus tigrinus ALCF2SS1-7]|uniref:DUF6699 domain-containing protein n=1 Tax=Lentinus tigrinus ALCF2SS1-6 TaxID=1328759 RepID=A0A5C2RQ72_9APHY|nr:hypothetical protein L227DRAFT_616757 [Lentinus tigrinus ALCF2SS1-6]RPD70537.1 hypothetical protein L226DRAFT_525837 [Lentinus tigrinus ALCF2SS1-7]
MSRRRVHFADEPFTLSSSRSASTHPTHMRQPPHTTQRRTSQGPTTSFSIPHRATVHAQLQVHPLLDATRSAPLDWDMSLPVESARVLLPSHPPRLIDTIVCQPATSHATESLAIICADLPWTITVTPTRGASWETPYVTVGDVLHTLYRALRLVVTGPELGVLDGAGRRRVNEAYVRRYRRIVDPCNRDLEKAKRIKRIDFLCDRRAFLGLSLVQGGIPARGLPHGAVWMLHTAPA